MDTPYKGICGRAGFSTVPVGFLVTFNLCVRLCVCHQNILKRVEPINFVSSFLDGNLPSDTGKKC